jgi:hypothetical protein
MIAMAKTYQLTTLLDEARAHPTDQAALEPLAEYLAKEGPGPVQIHQIPNWLRLAWLRTRPSGRRIFNGRTSGYAVLTDIDAWLGQVPDEYWHLDHHGTTVVGGLPCFASEPYRDLPTAWRQAKALAGAVGCLGLGLPLGAWNPRTVRILLIPLPHQLPQRRKKV